MILKTRTDTAHMVRMKTPSQKMTQITLMPGFVQGLEHGIVAARPFGGPTEGRDHRDTSRERQQYGPCAACGGIGHSAHFRWRRCKFCKQVHEVGQCELFRRYEKLASFVKNNVDKSKVPEELQDLYSSTATRRYDGVTPRPRVVKLLRGERLGWWSSQKFDRRVRMRALVMGAVNDRRVKILLDTGANVSAVSSTLARKLRLKQYASRDQQIDIQGIGKDKVSTTHKALVKVTLGWEVIYEFEVWIMPHHAGVDLILGTDFMIPAGIRLDLYNSAAKLPDEVVVPLVRSLKDIDDQTYGLQTEDGPTEAVCLSDRATAEFKLRRKQPSELTHEFWVRRTEDWIPTIVMNAKGKTTRYTANVGTVPSTLPGCNLATTWEATTRREGRDEESHLTQLDMSETCLEGQADSADEAYNDSDGLEATHDAIANNPEEDLRLRFLAATASASDGEPVAESDHRFTHFKRKGETLHLEDYAHELAFLPDLSEEVPIKLDYNGTNVKCSAHTPEQATRLTELLKRNEQIMISSGNALPPPAYGVVCDIDVGNHPPIKQRARRVALKYLKPLYELLKGLLRAKLVSFSKSPWVSPIVIVLKKNGVDIRLCIDYKKVNAITMIMEYAMPLVDDLLSELEKYLWFCSLDAASGFWAVMMTSRARRISAFVCALGHFEWLRMPFGLKNAPMIYQRMIDNALWGYVQPKGGWSEFARRIRRAEEVAATRRQSQGGDPTQPPSSLTKFAADNRALAELDPLQELIDSPEGDMFTCGEPDQSVLTPVFTRRSFVDDICFGGATFGECLETLDRLLTRLAECRISLSFSKSIFVQPKVGFLSHEVTSEGIRADPKKTLAIAELPFPKSKKGIQAFLGALNYYGRFIQNLAVHGAVLYQLKDSDFDGIKDLSTAEAAFAELKRRVVTAPILRHFDSAKEVHIMLFANDWALSSTLMQMHNDKLHPVRFCGRVLKKNEVNYHPAEKEVLALLQLLKICHTLLAGKVLHVYTRFSNRFSTLEWVFQSTSLYDRVVSFAVLLSPYHLKIKRVRERDVDFVQLLQASVTPHVGLDESLEHIAPPSTNSATVRLDPELLYAKLPRYYKGHVLSFDGSAKTEKNGGYGSCSWILWRLPEWDIEIAATCKKETLQVELARHKESTKKLNSVKYLHVIRLYNSAADSMATEALETQISRVVLNAERKAELKALNRIPEFCIRPVTALVTARKVRKRVQLLVARNKQAITSKRGRLDSAGSHLSELELRRHQPARRIETSDEAEFGDTQPSSQGNEVELNASRAPSADNIDPAVVQAERRRRIDKAQDEELRWADLKAYVRGELSQLSFRRV
ncbi:Hypothetical protein PHPALM_1444 [Phytophthora palmivora]|uniref:Peptidase A2 domain-containing protein n=1 Tax=Phytophthora palmivora TaxID=4796 RepID=A0A2P4YSB6_9STRA|nr:Hypothetical protein PHPALM_1444 [Phytophthora palmivora]